MKKILVAMSSLILATVSAARIPPPRTTDFAASRSDEIATFRVQRQDEFGAQTPKGRPLPDCPTTPSYTM
jgi:hypothetical protein